jgi:phage gp46-like protein
MTLEVAIAWRGEGTSADWTLTGGGTLATATPLETAILVSLFTDRRAGPDDRLVPGETDRRGWWGGQLEDEPIGSRLWLLRRAKRLPATLQLAKDYIREALAWLTDADIVASFDISAEWQGASRMNFTVVAHRQDGRRETVTASWAWQGA